MNLLISFVYDIVALILLVAASKNNDVVHAVIGGSFLIAAVLNDICYGIYHHKK